MGLLVVWVVHLVMDLEVNGSNPDGVKYYSSRLSFESNSSDISGFMFQFEVNVVNRAFLLSN